MAIDLIIRNAKVLDGTGSPAYQADVEVDDGRIRHVGSTSATARVEIDAQGAHLAPGFIDVHSHDDGAFIRHPGMAFKLAQGVTTCVCGNCGFRAIPVLAGADQASASGGILAGLQGSFTDLEGYFAEASAKGPAVNNIMLVGHNTVRSMVMGLAQRPRGKPHPRLFGTFPRVLGEYVRRRGVLSLEEAVRRMTSVSADTFGLVDRGRIEPGRFADLVLFDAGEIEDLATYDEPKQEPAGMKAVVVNGQLAYRDGVHTGAGAGQMLRYRRSAWTPAARAARV